VHGLPVNSLCRPPEKRRQQPILPLPAVFLCEKSFYFHCNTLILPLYAAFAPGPLFLKDSTRGKPHCGVKPRMAGMWGLTAGKPDGRAPQV
jgi:hypothetical protein